MLKEAVAPHVEDEWTLSGSWGVLLFLASPLLLALRNQHQLKMANRGYDVVVDVDAEVHAFMFPSYRSF